MSLRHAVDWTGYFYTWRFRLRYCLYSLGSTLITGYLVSTVFRGLHLMVVGMVIGPIGGLILFSGLLIFFAGLYAMIQFRGM